MSRISIFMESCNGKFPNENSMLSVSFIKNILNAENKDFAKSIFNYGEEGKNNKQIKDINTAIYIPNLIRSKNELLVDGDIIFNISFYNYSMFSKLYNGILKVKELEYKGYRFKIKNIKIHKEHEIKENGVIFKTMSPIIVKNKEGKYLDVEDSNYIECLNYIANLTLESIRGRGLIKPLEFIPLNFKKRVLKEKIRGFKEREYYYINAYAGTFFLKGDVKDLNALYKMGIGYRRTENAGMVDILK
ncbi:CRISPR-associated endoribonuclease Cas6 [Clostridioides sp. ES-S-0108-01]|uniref:CRISPR-associated endoribonuclease Cas6 n=1 Tax=Clostridioides sp. ES-S-0108-01 TaxID=2770773 RepID=UPI001D0CA18E|nr:CRISPR-associated endoribonuclease Cas6 [Clostridioides sp. ES-S-0108-01]UDN50126.1 CRISPR-associated endoribonuclease Cas6 [Clostridioides sp. ES-S-0107-01]